MAQKRSMADGDGPQQGLEYHPNVLSPLQQQQCLAWIDTFPFFHVGKGKASRRYQHYGYEYNYKSRRVKKIGELGDAPHSIISSIRDMIAPARKAAGLGPDLPDEYWDQCIVNEYLPGQEITWHTDSDNFGEHIACFTLGDPEVMEFRIGGLVESITPQAGSFYLMKGGSRWKAQHRMRKKRRGPPGGHGRRVSVTFRHVGSAQ